jgi:dTDP-4-amino-4,6-dideoxygalactose transaminase
VLDRGIYILGEEVRDFEKEFASYIGVTDGIGVGSGTEALHLALAACELKPGNEVITVSHTAVATVAAIEMAGALPVLVDIEPDYYTIDPDKILSAITPKTKAIIPVHLYGHPAALQPILDIAEKFGLWVIEDCAQAHGAMYKGKRVGSFGHLACFSFYPTKNLGAIGDGGMVVTNDSDMGHRVRSLREYGWGERYVSHTPSFNSRLDEVQAAILRVKLPHLDQGNSLRAQIADTYQADLHNCDLTPPVCRQEDRHVYHLYVVRSPRWDALQQHLQDHEIAALIHYPVPVHLQPAYQGRVSCGSTLIETERAAKEILSLPIYPELNTLQQQSIIKAVQQF